MNILEGCETKNIVGVCARLIHDALREVSKEGWLLYRVDPWDAGVPQPDGSYRAQLPGHLYYSLAMRRPLK